MGKTTPLPTPAQRVALEVLLRSPQMCGGHTVQVHQNLVTLGWATFREASGAITNESWKALNTEITRMGRTTLKRAVDLERRAKKLRRHLSRVVPEGAYLVTASHTGTPHPRITAFLHEVAGEPPRPVRFEWRRGVSWASWRIAALPKAVGVAERLSKLRTVLRVELYERRQNGDWRKVATYKLVEASRVSVERSVEA